jgi:pimeloyl-ACP methyl ester carboxylesterase
MGNVMGATTRDAALPPAVPGERRELTSIAGRLSYYVAGPPRDRGSIPLLLLHSINAAGSAYEVKPLFERFQVRRTVYALDLPGFGFSDRSDRRYRPRLMTDAIHAMVEEIRRGHGQVPIDALAVSLSSEFLARAAYEEPDAFRSLALTSPTGFDRRAPYTGATGSTRGNAALYAALNFPLWREGLFRLLTSRPSIRYFLQKTWGSKEIDEGLLNYDYVTTHRPGAYHAPYDFVSGFLFSSDISTIYGALKLPVWMSHGVRGDFTDYSWTSNVERKSNWVVHEFPTGALPYFEMTGLFVQRYEMFLDRVAAVGIGQREQS